MDISSPSSLPESNIPLFSAYPGLRTRIPRIPLGSFPTPVTPLSRFGREIGAHRLYLKRDDLSGSTYGGNKVRKLELLLGEALERGSKTVLTFGFAGSNHALATALYSRELGLKCISLLLPQPNAIYVRNNLLAAHHAGAELVPCRSLVDLVVRTLYLMLREKRKEGRSPLVIPPGGSSSRGITGFVNAAFELREQINAGEMPEPDRIYVAMGTMGTSAGLILGCAAAGIRSRIIPVRVVDEKYADRKKLHRLIKKTNEFLSSCDASFPSFPEAGSHVLIRQEYFGRKYALFTGEGMMALTRMREAEGIVLEGTYTAKTLAALIEDARDGGMGGEEVLFWNTYNSIDFSGQIATVDYRRLPRSLYRYFEEEVQPLERAYSGEEIR